MSDVTPSLDSYEEGGSITADKMRTAAEKIDVPDKGGRLLSPHRDDTAD